MSYYHYLATGILLLIMACNFKDSRKRAERLSKLGIQYIDCGISGGVYGLERGYCLMVGGATGAVSVCAHFQDLAPGLSAAPAQIHTAAQHLLSMGGYIVGDLGRSFRKDGS